MNELHPQMLLRSDKQHRSVKVKACLHEIHPYKEMNQMNPQKNHKFNTIVDLSP